MTDRLHTSGRDKPGPEYAEWFAARNMDIAFAFMLHQGAYIIVADTWKRQPRLLVNIGETVCYSPETLEVWVEGHQPVSLVD